MKSIIHAHICENTPNATEIWIIQAGKYYLCHNNPRIPERTLRNIMKIDTHSDAIIWKWEG